MPIPKPAPSETKKDFLDRCMADPVMVSEYENDAQRYAVCISSWEGERSALDAVVSLTGDIETRTWRRGELRLAEDGGVPVLIGEPGIPYDSFSEDLGGFVEKINPRALDGMLADGNIICCFNHDDSLILGSTASGTLSLKNTPKGLNYACKLGDRTYEENLVKSVKRGDVRGSSFRFSVIEDRWENNLREVLKMELYEVGPVTMPAYPSTALSLRSLLRSLGVDARALGVAVRRARGGEPQGQDIDVIAGAIKALNDCLPSPGQGPAGGMEDYRQGLEILHMRLRLLEI